MMVMEIYQKIIHGDEVHIYGKYYKEWSEWLSKNIKGGN